MIWGKIDFVCSRTGSFDVRHFVLTAAQRFLLKVLFLRSSKCFFCLSSDYLCNYSNFKRKSVVIWWGDKRGICKTLFLDQKVSTLRTKKSEGSDVCVPGLKPSINWMMVKRGTAPTHWNFSLAFFLPSCKEIVFWFRYDMQRFNGQFAQITGYCTGWMVTIWVFFWFNLSLKSFDQLFLP